MNPGCIRNRPVFAAIYCIKGLSMLDRKAEELAFLLNAKKQYLVLHAFFSLYRVKEKFEVAKTIYGEVCLRVIEQKDKYFGFQEPQRYLKIKNLTRDLARYENEIYVPAPFENSNSNSDSNSRHEVPNEHIIDGYEQIQQHEFMEYFFRCADSLTNEDRDIFLFVTLNAFSYETISRIFSISKETARKRLSRATIKVIECLEGIYGEQFS